MKRGPGKKQSPETIVIAGLGMLGGSLGLALSRLEPRPRILGLARREASIAEAVAAGIIDGGGTRPEEILPQADLTVLCIPVVDSIDFALTHAALWRFGTLVTDVGSVKASLVESLAPVLARNGVQFVGSHPMAGSENSGLPHANAKLYRNATVFVTPAPENPAAAVDRICRFWHELGAWPCLLTPDRHDALVARTSHMLHVAAAAAATVVLKDPEAGLGTAGGFRDFTRIASSSPEMWSQIFQANRDEVLAALDEFESELTRFRDWLRNGDWDAVRHHLVAARDLREKWLQEKRKA